MSKFSKQVRYWVKRPSGPRPADTERTPTHTHTPFSQRQGTTWTTPSLFPGFSPLVARTPVPAAGSPGRRGFENHRPKTDHTHKTSPFSVLPRVLRTPDTPHTYLHSLFPLAITIAPYTDCSLPCLRLFDYPFSESWCTEPWNPASYFLEFTLFRFGDATLIR